MLRRGLDLDALEDLLCLTVAEVQGLGDLVGEREGGREGGRGELEKRGYLLLTYKQFVKMPVHISL